MRRVVNLWLALLAAYWLVRAAASSLLFGRVDHGYPALVELLAIPALQAIALAWATRQPGSLQLALPWREGWRLLPLRGALAVDAGVLAVAWLMPAAYRPSWLAPSLDAGLPGWLTALKLAGAAALLVAALCRQGWRARDRLAVAAVAAALLALSAEPWRGWLAGLPGLPALAASPSPRWFGAYAMAAAAALLLVLQAASALQRHSQAAALAFDWALGLLLAAAGCAALGFVRQPAAAAAPWTHAAAILGWLSGTAMLVGAALAAAGGSHVAARPGEPA
ncbi:MAG TPA: hypothetical protein VE075_00175 [Thermoanaerobaculia bacterium]|nr:hypothetical protein [Thermoanaerobaculia bacterium]